MAKGKGRSLPGIDAGMDDAWIEAFVRPVRRDRIRLLIARERWNDLFYKFQQDVFTAPHVYHCNTTEKTREMLRQHGIQFRESQGLHEHQGFVQPATLADAFDYVREASSVAVITVNRTEALMARLESVFTHVFINK